jgi:hypothetical protein
MNFINKKLSDISSANGRIRSVDLRREETVPVLFSRGKKSKRFFTEDSQLYITPREQEMIRNGVELNRRDNKKWDSANSRIVQNIVHNFVRSMPEKKESVLIENLENRFEMLNDSFSELSQSFFGQLSMVRLWNLSIVGSILFGMVMMTFIYRYLGQGAAAEQLRPVAAVEQQVIQKSSDDGQTFADQVLAIENGKEQSLEKEIREMTKGYPIEKMAPFIAKKDRTTAAFLVGIAKKESSWGEHHPVLNGQDCYNYWGYRGERQLMGTGGHTCFNSPKDAVDTVSKRLETLIEKYGNDTPAEMVEPWKCGYDCAATGGRAAANKWVSDVMTPFEKLNDR